MSAGSIKSRTIRSTLIFLTINAALLPLWAKISLPYDNLVAAIAQDNFGKTDSREEACFIWANAGYFCVRIVKLSPLPDLSIAKDTYQNQWERGLVTMNTLLWITLFLATFGFIDVKVRWTFLLLGGAIVFFSHMLFFALAVKFSYWSLVSESPSLEPNGLLGQCASFIWIWAHKFDSFILQLFLPFIIWVLICSRSFFKRSGAKQEKLLGSLNPTNSRNKKTKVKPL